MTNQTTDTIHTSEPSKAETVKSKAREMTNTAVNSAKAEVRARGAEAQETVASEVEGTADALRTAANEMRDGSPQGAAMSYAADQLAEFSDNIRQQDLSQVVETATYYARRHPIAFIGGAVALGIMASRFMTASRPVARAPMDDPYMKRRNLSTTERRYG